MKILTTALAVITLSASASANAEVSKYDFCYAHSELSESVMTARQGGVSMRDAIEAVMGDEIAIAIIQDAYEVPGYSTAEFQQKAILEFSDLIYAECLSLFD